MNEYEDFINLGKKYFLEKNYEKAKEAYEKAIELDPKDARAYNNLANVYYEEKDYEKAKEAYEKAIELDPNFAGAYNNLGILYYKEKDYEKAKEAYEKAIELDPNFAIAYFNLANVYDEEKDYEKAKEAYEKAIELDPKYAKAYNNLGILYYEEKDYEKAKEAYEKAIELDPNNAIAYNNLANVYDEEKDYEKAGLIYYSIKEYDKAIERFEKLIENDKENTIVYYYLGVCYDEVYKKGKGDNNKENAQKNFDEAKARTIKNAKDDEAKARTIKNAKDNAKEKKENIYYKFRPINKNTITMLINNEIYFSDTKKLNDPFDCPIESYERYGFKPKVLSLVKYKENFKNIENILMFSHYADEHKGICIEYEFDDNFLDKDIFFDEVKYKKELEYKNLQDIFTIKYKDWKYENEVRFISFDENNLIKLGKKARIKSIIFACETSKEDKELIKNLVKGRDIKLFEANKDIRYPFKLNIVEFEKKSEENKPHPILITKTLTQKPR